MSTEATTDPKLVGNINEVVLNINGKQTSALLDTWSCISLISESFYNQHLSDTPLEPLTEVLNVECADGKPLPYLGCIEANIEVTKD